MQNELGILVLVFSFSPREYVVSSLVANPIAALSAAACGSILSGALEGTPSLICTNPKKYMGGDQYSWPANAHGYHLDHVEDLLIYPPCAFGGQADGRLPIPITASEFLAVPEDSWLGLGSWA